MNELLATYTEYNRTSSTLYVAYLVTKNTYVVRAVTSQSIYLISTLIESAIESGIYINKEQANYLFPKMAGQFEYGDAKQQPLKKPAHTA